MENEDLIIIFLFGLTTKGHFHSTDHSTPMFSIVLVISLLIVGPVFLLLTVEPLTSSHVVSFFSRIFRQEPVNDWRSTSTSQVFGTSPTTL